MDRQESPPARSSLKTALAGGLKLIRTEIYGEDGQAELATRLGLPPRTWANYERGVTVPGEVLLGFIELTGTAPLWLFRGVGRKYPAG